MFQVGDYVVDSMNGICKIEDAVTLDYAEDKNKRYFLLIPVNDTKAKVYTPVESADGRFRKALTESEITDLISNINEIDSVWIENDKERERIYKNALKSCEPKLLIGIIKTLYFRREKRSQEGKKNTALDDKYFQIAEDHLYTEIGLVLKLDNEQVKEMIKEKVNDQDSDE